MERIWFNALACFATQVCAGFIFGFQVFGPSVAIQDGIYAGVWVVFALLLLWTHIKTSKSAAVLETLRLLRLSASTTV